MSSHKNIDFTEFRMDLKCYISVFDEVLVDNYVHDIRSKDMTQFLEFSPAEIASCCTREVKRTGKGKLQTSMPQCKHTVLQTFREYAISYIMYMAVIILMQFVY